MSTSSSDSGRVSSPLSTGGAGNSFEQHVDASFLALLLIRGIPPVFLDSQIVEVSFQTEHLGWATDDILVTCTNASGTQRRLVGQMKRSFTVSAKDEECEKAILDFWRDFQPGKNFQRDADCFVLFVLRGTNTLLGGLGELLEAARACRDAAEFARRLATPGMLNKTAIEYSKEIRAIIAKSSPSLSDEEFWMFLKSLNVVSYDLNNGTRTTESQIKSILAVTSHSGNGTLAAETTWNELLGLVDHAMPQAQSFRWEHLPPAMRERHSSAPDVATKTMQKLSEHSVPVLAAAKNTIAGSIELPRTELKQLAINAALAFPITIITGPSGSGKSALAKAVYRQLTSRRPGFAFRAEEFVAPHLDAVLQNAQIGVNGSQLLGVFAGQSETVVLIESVERLLEAATRDAFFDLIRTLPRDGSWRLILTCRDYSLDIVRSSFLAQLEAPHEVISVPALTDQELQEVIKSFPALARADSVAGLRKLLRNPYFLDKAARMDWSEQRPLPTDERAFRDKFWGEIVRRDDMRDEAFPRRREEAFRSLCLRRARSLAVYARCDDLDRDALSKLQADGLITYSKSTDALATPAHDVLEDWALIRWIDEQVAILEAAPAPIAAELGTFPAVRRAYRKWLVEWLECQPTLADKYVGAVLQDSSLPNYFRDDTLTAILTSSQSVSFLQRMSALLMENDAAMLRRVVHLLRVACMAPPSWLHGTELSYQFLIPDGPAWAAVLEAVRGALDRLLPTYKGLLLGLIEDWSRIVAIWNQYPAGSDAAAAIATTLVPHFDSYNHEEQRKKALSVLAKIPKADTATVTELLRRGITCDRRDHSADDFAEVVLDAITGAAVCRDFPDEVIALAMGRLKLREREDDQWYRGFSGIDLEPVFGLEDHTGRGSFPASSFQGPFLPLLQHHPAKALLFIVDLMNHCFDAYAANTESGHSIEPPFTIELAFPDGTKVSQHANGRLWNLYRGTSVGPYILQSALMAMERVLLELVNSAPQSIDSILTSLLRRSNNVAVSAVVASVVTAHPRSAPETAMILLRCSGFILLDRMRFANESQSPSHMLAAFAYMRSHDRHHDEERNTSDKLKHRQADLETVAPTLQLTEHSVRVCEIIDNHYAQLPPVAEQTDEDRIWRLALRRMDIRKYEIDKKPPEEAPVSKEVQSTCDPNATGDDAQTRSVQIPLRLSAPEQDIQEMIDRGSAQETAFNTAIELINWGMAVFEGTTETRARPEDWKKFLTKARSATEAGPLRDTSGLPGLSCGGPAFIAAVCVRDHWEELDQAGRDWCIGQLESSLLEDAETTNEATRASRGGMEAAVPAAIATPILLTKALDELTAARVKNMLAVAMCHSVSNIVRRAAGAVGREHSKISSEVLHGCAAAIVERAKQMKSAFDRLRHWIPEERAQYEQEGLEAARRASELVNGTRNYSGNPFADIDMNDWRECYALYDLIPLLVHSRDSEVAQDFFRRLAGIVADWWGEDRQQRSSRRERPYELEHYCVEGLAIFAHRLPKEQAIQICAPLVAKVSSEPREVATFISDLITNEDRSPNKDVFWAIWGLFADAATRATWLPQTDQEHCSGRELIDNLFLGHYWKDGVTHWSTLDGYADRVANFARALPPSAAPFEAYARFLYKVGRQSLPDAFVVLAERLRAGNASTILRRSNTRFLLESILRPFVYAMIHQVKADSQLREAILFILDSLIDAGSSAAYRMREDFLTPIPPPEAAYA